MIKRAAKTGIIRTLQFFPAVGILGPRQVGKTTLAKTLVEELDKPSLYFDLELPSDYELLSQNATLIADTNQDKTIIIDEVQRLLPIFPQLRALIDRNRQPARFILLGSASPEFLQKSSESLAGRIAYHELSPIVAGEASSSGINLQQHWHRGGFPDALLAPNDEFWWLWQQNFIKTYVEQDLSRMGINVSSPTLNNFLRILSHVHGGLLNYATVAGSLGLNSHNVKRYMEIFEQAYLVRRLEPWHVNIPKRIVKSSKLYIRDSGNLHFLHGIKRFDEIVQHPIAGASWEGYVIEQVISTLSESIRPFFYRTSNGAEMDLVLIDGLRPIVSIEIKLSSTPALTRGSLESVIDLKTQNNFLVTPSGRNISFREDWIHCNLADLLTHLRDLKLTN